MDIVEYKIPERKFLLPKVEYGPISMKILKEFVSYHKLEGEILYPEKDLDLSICLSRILHIMVKSMGKDWEKNIQDNLDEYNMTIPAFYRNY